jgi:nucleolar protein 56
LSETKEGGGEVHVVETLIGVFGVTGGNEIVEKALYPPDPKQMAAALKRQAEGEVTKEVAELVEKLKQRGFRRLVFTNGALADSARERFSINASIVPRSKPSDYVRGRLEELAVEHRMVDDVSKYYSLSHEVSMLRARRAVRAAQSEREAVVSQAVQLLNELDKTLNVLSSKLREWYGLHFPELSRLVDSHEDYAGLVKTLGDRAQMSAGALDGLGLKGRRSAAIPRAAVGSMGASLMPDDLEQLQRLASHILSLYGYRQGLEAHITSVSREVAPSLSEVAGPVLAAKLIEKAGGLRRLAMMPSSTVQLLGAEKALFRAKKTGSRPPKHGLVFQHPYVHSKPRKLRGRSARVLASKLSIAARADAFTGADLGAKLRRELNEPKDETENHTQK